ncbi:MAG: DUF2007 domain-containing protein [Pseudomonadota bacterium]
MQLLARTNDPVTLSYIVALLNEADIAHVVLDQNMSLLEGSIGIIPRRVMVGDETIGQARLLLRGADLERWLVPEGEAG